MWEPALTWRRAVLALAVALACAVAVPRLLASGGAFAGTIPVGTAPSALAVDERRGRVFVANTYDATVSVLDAARGTVLRTVAVAPSPVAIAVAERPGHAFVLSSNVSSMGLPIGPSVVSMLDARTGALLHAATIGPPAGLLAVDEQTGRVFICSEAGDSVSTLDAETGRLLGTVTVGFAPQAKAVDAASGHVFTANYGGYSLSMLDARNGTVLRTIPLKIGSQSPETLTLGARSGRVFVVSSSGGGATGALSMLDARTGRVLVPVLARGELPFAVDPRRGRLITFTLVRNAALLRDARTGAALRALPGAWLGGFIVNWNHGAAVDPRTGRLYTVAWDGAVRVLDGWSGRLLRQAQAGAQPSALALDTRTRQVIVANLLGHGATNSDAWAWLPSWLRRWLPWLPHAPASGGSRGSVSVIPMAP